MSCFKNECEGFIRFPNARNICGFIVFERLETCSLQSRRDFLRTSGEQGRRRGKREASAMRELRARGGSLKDPACPHTIVQAVPAFKYERSYLIGYFKTRDLRMFFQDITRSRTVI